MDAAALKDSIDVVPIVVCINQAIFSINTWITPRYINTFTTDPKKITVGIACYTNRITRKALICNVLYSHIVPFLFEEKKKNQTVKLL